MFSNRLKKIILTEVITSVYPNRNRDKMCFLCGFTQTYIEREDLPGFIIGIYNLYNIKYTDDTLLIVDSEWK